MTATQWAEFAGLGFAMAVLAWGFVVSAAAYGWVYARNALLWMRPVEAE